MLLSEMTLQRFERTCREAWAPALVLVVLTLFLAACGFKPLYGRHGAGTLPAEQYLARINIEQVADRVGQQLRNNLLSRLNPKGPSADPLYSLSINVTESITNLVIKKSAVVTRGNLRIAASYSMALVRGVGAGEGGLASGTVLSTSSYDIPQDQFAARAALKDARARAVKEIADDMRTRLAVYFKQNADKL
jgi:LPS-assembly lipoprotein